ncbi:TPA: hypothetical protein ACTW3X_000805 [Klebsiella pneumoniae]
MTTDINELAQRNELLIANGNETVHLLRHLAENEIDSDYFAVVTECESYGMEVDAELEITKFARHAAEHVAALVEALEKAQQRIAELEDAEQKLCAANVTLDARSELADRQLAELESRTVKLPTTRLLAGVTECYEKSDVIAAIRAAGMEVSDD